MIASFGNSTLLTRVKFPKLAITTRGRPTFGRDGQLPAAAGTHRCRTVCATVMAWLSGTSVRSPCHPISTRRLKPQRRNRARRSAHGSLRRRPIGCAWRPGAEASRNGRPSTARSPLTSWLKDWLAPVRCLDARKLAAGQRDGHYLRRRRPRCRGAKRSADVGPACRLACRGNHPDCARSSAGAGMERRWSTPSESCPAVGHVRHRAALREASPARRCIGGSCPPFRYR
jgi:hypothetical protein